MPIADIGCDSGCAPNTKTEVLDLTYPDEYLYENLGWSDWNKQRATSRGRKHEWTLVRKPDAGNPHVRFDERGLETERASSPPRHFSTLPSLDDGRLAAIFSSQKQARTAL